MPELILEGLCVLAFLAPFGLAVIPVAMAIEGLSE